MRAAGASDDKRPLDGAFGMIGAILNVARNAEIFGEEEEAEYLYQVISGCVRTCRVLNDGRRQVGAFYLPGDIIGIEAGREHAFSAEAIVSSTVRVLKRSIINSRASGDSTIARHLLDLSVTELQRTQAHALLLVKTALERVAGFLLEAALRAESRSEVQLPMSRQDIADYLGLTIETVSRTLSHLEHAKAIALPTPHRVILRNRAMLEELSAA
jgi:CRP/FNR family nitrogen fixation transcriptional regulator